MMMYKFLKKMEVKGYFKEPMFDECPRMGTYRRDITRIYQAGDIMIAKPVNNTMVQLDDSSYGVSMHGSVTNLHMNIEELKASGVLYEMSEEEKEKYYRVQAARKKYDEALMEEIMMEDYIHDDPFEATDATWDKYVSCIIASIRARANLIIAQI